MEKISESNIREQIILERNEASIFKNNTQISEEIINRFYKFYKYFKDKKLLHKIIKFIEQTKKH